MAVVAFRCVDPDRNRNYAKMKRQRDRHMYVLLSEEVHQPPFGRTLIDIAGMIIIECQMPLVNKLRQKNAKEKNRGGKMNFTAISIDKTMSIY